ncbi:carbohydrate porin [Lichenicoccus roseus]|nr:carbohydrate porin [Lichenicoccus roseus]
MAIAFAIGSIDLLSRGAMAQAPAPIDGQPIPTTPAVTGSRVPGQTGVATPPPAPSAEAPTGIWQRPNLLGNMGGLRSVLGRYGIALGLNETDEVFGNATGGTRRGTDYDGLTVLSVGLDTSSAFGWAGGSFNLSALQIHGRNLSSDNLYTLQSATGIEAYRSTRLWEAWFQQTFMGGKLDLKLGQQSVDLEFITSQGSSLFTNTVMGWPALPSLDLYAGGPAYPLSSLGIRLRAQPADNVALLLGVFDDNAPGGPIDDDSQLRGAAQSGTRFNTGTGALLIAEVQYAFNLPSAGVPQTGAPPPAEPVTQLPPPGLPGVYKLGAYVDTGDYLDQRFDEDGLSLGDPASVGRPHRRSGNFGIYGVMDQTIWRPDPQGARAVGIFARLMGGPGDRNLADFTLNTGITLKSPLHGRDNDTVGLGYGLVRISHAVSALDQDRIAASGLALPIRSSESFIELTYQAQIVAWWSMQPDLQYVFTPGGGIADPLRPGRRISNELVVGARTIVTF